jgi:type IV pilus assembly protein PilA
MKLKSGFSLIELLVVVAIIGILAAIGTVGYNNYISQAQTAAYLANDKQISDALIVEDAQLTKCGNAGGDAHACADIIAAESNIQYDWWGCQNGKANIGGVLTSLGNSLACH